MSAPSSLWKAAGAAAALFGLALTVALVARIGWAAVWDAARALGWSGFGLFLLYSLALYGLLGLAWRVLLPARICPLAFGFARLVRDSAAELLPFSHVGGFVIGARALSLGGATLPQAFASTVVDITTELLAQIAYIAMGVALLFLRTDLYSPLVGAFLAGLVVLIVAGAGVLAAQRHGLNMMKKIITRVLPQALTSVAAVAQAVDAIYRHPGRVAASAALHLTGWIGGALASFLVLRLSGREIGFLPVLAIESLLCGIRSAAFFMPSAMGVQEAAYAVLGPVFGLPAASALALSLVKRARDVGLGVPTLLAWQAMEGRRLLGASQE